MFWIIICGFRLLMVLVYILFSVVSIFGWVLLFSDMVWVWVCLMLVLIFLIILCLCMNWCFSCSIVSVSWGSILFWFWLCR